MSASDSDISSISPSKEPRGAIRAEREIVTKIERMDPFYDFPRGRLMTTSQIDSEEEDEKSDPGVARYQPPRHFEDRDDEHHKAEETFRETTTALIQAQNARTDDLEDFTMHMTTVLRQLVEEVKTVRMTLKSPNTDSGCYPSPIPRQTSSTVGHDDDLPQPEAFHAQGARPKKKPASGQQGNSSLEVQVGSPKQGQGRVYSYSDSDSDTEEYVQPKRRQGILTNSSLNRREPQIPARQLQPPCHELSRPKTPTPVRSPSQVDYEYTTASRLVNNTPQTVSGPRVSFQDDQEAPRAGRSFARRNEWGHWLASYPEEREMYPTNMAAATPASPGVPRNYPESRQLAYDHYGYQGLSPHHGEIDLSDPVNNMARPIPVYEWYPAAYARPGNPCTTRQGDEYPWTPIRADEPPYGVYRARHRPKCMPRRFDGTDSWEEYLIHFNTVAGLNGWTQEDRAHFLVASLDGEARGSLTTMYQQGTLGNLGAILNTLAQDFGNQSRAPVYRAELKCRRRKEGETIADLARSIRKLASLAYPEVTPAVQETLATDSFREALDYETAWAVQQAQCTSMAQAAKIAMELEAFRLAERRKNQPRKFARIVVAEEEDEEAPEEKALLKNLVKEIKEMIRDGNMPVTNPRRRLERRDQSNAPARRPNNGRRDLSKVQCWNCSQYGHYRNDCPEPRHDGETAGPHNRPENY